MRTNSWSRIEMSIATKEEIDTLDKMDYTKLSAINMCPTWGILRYGMHKAMPGGGRSMALEAGTALHDCFAVIRLMQLSLYQGMEAHVLYHGQRLFGKDRWAAIVEGVRGPDRDACVRNAALECLATSGYVDDPSDRRRTFNNLETSLLYYIQRWDFHRHPVWMRDADDPTSDIGVEIPFAIKIQPYTNDGFSYYEDYELMPFIYTGRIDGLHCAAQDSEELIIQENKSASRLDDAWRMSFDMSHQVTGYCVAGSLHTNTSISRGLVLGLALPLPRYASDGLSIVDVYRDSHMKARWLQWLEYTTGIYNAYKDNPMTAPKHTHSCNRYFRPCSMIPFCASDDQEQRDMLTQMVTDEWSPLHDKAGD
jgi:hypothetical protein